MPACREKIISEAFADYIVEYVGSIERVYEQYQTDCVQKINERYAVIHLPVSSMEDAVGVMTYNGVPKLYGLMDTSSMDSSGITRIQNQPYLNLLGQDIIVGIIDTGIDYENALFRTSDGGSRIIGLWDQTIETDTAGQMPTAGDMAAGDYLKPAVNYGTAYSRADINRALQSAQPVTVLPSIDRTGHGTYLAGIAAGGQDIANDFTGAAPRADIAAVKLKPAKQYLRDYYLINEDSDAFQENDLMSAVLYLRQLAQLYQKPISICIGLGTSSGNHNGASYLSSYLDLVGSVSGVVISTAAGNESNRGGHFFGQLDDPEDMLEVELKVGEDQEGFALEMWSIAPDIFSIGFVSPGGQVIERIPSAGDGRREIKFVLEPTQIFLTYQMGELASGSQVVFMRFMAPVPGIWRIRVYGDRANLYNSFNMWLPIRNFIGDQTFFLQPQPDTTITSPGDGTVPISAGAYNHYNNSIYIYSGRGFRPDNDIVPSICAPGVNVFGPAPGGRFTTRSGTSVAAAHVCGAAALLLQWGFFRQGMYIISTVQVKQYFARSALRLPDVIYPSRIWGYGTLDLYRAFEILTR